MPKAVTRDHHSLRRNLKLNGNYISNDGGDGGIKISDDGIMTLTPEGGAVLTTLGAYDFKMELNGAQDNYFNINFFSGSGRTLISTNDDGGGTDADLVFNIDGNIECTPGPNSYFSITPATKTTSSNFDASLDLRETLDSDTGGAGEFTADGDDIHYGIRYRQTQTDIAGWDSVYLMHLDGGNKFTVDDKAQVMIDINDTATATSTNKGMHIDIDSTGTMGASQTLTNIGLDLDINRDSGNGHVTSSTNTTGIDIDLVGHATGINNQTGIDINLSGGGVGNDDNVGISITVADAANLYALITSGGNVGIGESAPQDTLEVNGTILVKDKLKFTQDDGDEYIDSLNDGYLDIDATTAIRLKADTLIAGTKKLYFNDEGGEYISGSGANLTITAGSNLNIDVGGVLEFDGCGVGFDLETPTYNASDTDVNFINGNKQFVTFDGGDIADLNLIFPKVSGNFLLMLKQDGTGGRTVTSYKVWDRVDTSAAGGSATVKFAGGSNPDLTDDANHVDIISFFYDGDNEIAYGVATLDFQF